MPEKSPSSDSLAHRTTEFASGDRRRSESGREGAAPSSLPPEKVLADRYRLVRFLARGGMGEVYEAEDLVLRMRVALKCIAPELVADARLLRGLKQEVLLARKVSHPNVCRLHDLGFHSEDDKAIAFLTIDLLRGETLDAFLAREGPLGEERALPIVLQLTAALGAAHAAGVIHRDFKARNVMLVHVPGNEALRAVVMDFGLALGTGDDGATRSPDDAEVVGTPAYMAPEQIEGGVVTPATDVYALGVVLFEMVTGRLPFIGPNAAQVVYERLASPAPSPRRFAPSLSARWERAVLRCLAREASQRFASVDELASALSERPRAFWTRTSAAAGGAVTALLVGSAIAYFLASHRAPSRARSTGRPTLAVVATDDSPAEGTGWIATALGDILATELDADEALQVLPVARVARAEANAALTAEAAASKEGLPRLASALGADYVIVVHYRARPDASVSATVAMVDPKTGRNLRESTARGTTGALFDVAAPLAAAVRAELGVRDPTGREVEAARASVAGNPDAERWYQEGRAHLAADDYPPAIEAFEKAVKLDPAFALAHDGYAASLTAYGYDARALEQARLAFEQSRALSREQQLRIEQNYRAIAKEWPRATEVANVLVEFFPDNVDYRLKYARALNAGGHPHEALDAIDAIHALPARPDDDGRVDLMDAIVAGHLDLVDRSLAAAERAVAEAEKVHSNSVLADAHKRAGEALAQLGQLDAALVQYEAARLIYVKLGDREYEADVLQDVAQIALARGNPASAIPILERSLSLLRDVGARYETAGHVMNLGDAYAAVGDLGRAHALLVEARGLYEAIHDRNWAGEAMRRLSAVLLSEGDIPAARALLVSARAQVDPGEYRGALRDIALESAEAARLSGDVEEAVKDLQEAEAMDDNGLRVADTRLFQARLALTAGDRAQAEVLGDAALADFQKQGDAMSALSAHVFLARVALESNEPTTAETLARDAAEVAHAGGMKNDEADAALVLAQALAAEKKPQAASSALDRASSLDPTRVATQLDLSLARAAVLAAGGDLAGARLAEADAEKRAKKLGFSLSRRAGRTPAH